MHGLSRRASRCSSIPQRKACCSTVREKRAPFFDGQMGKKDAPKKSAHAAPKGDPSNKDQARMLTQKIFAGLALRYEDYSDFGSSLTGKLSGRVDFTDKLAARATVSNGFRAPGVQQLFFGLRSTNLNAAGVLTDTLTAPNNSDVTRALGIPPLKEETSKNYSLGFVARPSRSFQFTVDAYRVDIDDRIIFSGTIPPEDPNCTDPSVCPIGVVLNPRGTGQLKVNVTQGRYRVRAANADISPAQLTVGPERQSAQNALLQP